MEQYITELDDDNVLDLYKSIPIGKQLRSKLILNIAKNHQNEAIKLAAIVELIHVASLLHDDVIDESNTRRGQSSFNAKHGNKNAIMMGDILYSFGFSKLVTLPKEVAATISHAVSLLSLGELNDIKLSENINLSKDKYNKMIYQKTASLIEASAKSAAILEGLNSNDFAIYGKNLGLAFQIIDDVLDVIGDEVTLGKPCLSDFKEGKMTLPYIYMYEECILEEKEYVKKLYKKDLSVDEILWIQEIMAKYKSVDKCIKEAKKLGLEALSSIKKYKIDGLEKVITQMIDRDF